MKGMIVKSLIGGEHETLQVALPDGVSDVHVEMNRYYNEPRLGVGGLKLPDGIHVSWKGSKLQPGDEIHVEFADIEQPAPLVYQESHESLKERMTATLADNNENKELWQRKLERYHRLKALLEEEGLIEKEE